MITQAELGRIASALNAISGRAIDAVKQEFSKALASNNRADVSDALLSKVVALISQFGEGSASLGADMFESSAADLKVKPKTQLAPGANTARATSRVKWALSQPDQWGNLSSIVDELVKQPYRSTFQDSAIASGVGWARVPKGKTCDFCKMLASRGGVYSSKETASKTSSGKKYHGDCDCQPVLVRSEADYPKGYDPDALYREYRASQEADRLLERAREAEPAATKTMTDLADRHGMELTGLDFRLKTKESLARKIATEAADGLSAESVADSMSDVVRYTMLAKESRYAAGATSVLDDLRSEGWSTRVKNYWTRPEQPYQGINVALVSPDGQKMELQFHTPSSFDVKDGEGHRLYERQRVSTDPRERQALNVQMLRLFQGIPIPPGVDRVG